eukprot:gene10326-13881_t
MMYKILQVTDCHLALPGEMVFDSDPHRKLQAAIGDINRNHADAALRVFTGDLGDNSDPHQLEDRLLMQTIIIGGSIEKPVADVTVAPVRSSSRPAGFGKGRRIVLNGDVKRLPIGTGVGGYGACENTLDGSGFHHPAPLHHDDIFRHLPHHLQIV